MTVRITGKPEGCKLLRIEADIETDIAGGRIDRIMVRGDFFAFPEEGFERIEAGLAGTSPADLAHRFDELAAEYGVELVGVGAAAVAQLVQEALHAASIPAP